MTISVGSSACSTFKNRCDHLLFFRPGLAGIDLNHLLPVSPLEKPFRLDQLQQLARVRRVAGDDQHERLDDLVARLAGIGLQVDLDALVQSHAVFQFQLLDLLGRHARGIEVLPRDDRRFLDESIRHRLAQAGSR